MTRQLPICLCFVFGVAAIAAPLTQSTAPARAAASQKQTSQSGEKAGERTQRPGEPVPDQTTQKDKEDVVRISVTLVQVDAVVTDATGKYVTDLKPEDFEISEDGRRQHLTNFSYVSTAPARPSAPEASALTTGKATRNPTPVPPVRLRPDQVRRTLALVVDDLGLSFESTALLRDSLKKFVNEQMQPGDLVAIIRTGAGMGALQQFTTDKRLLNAAIEKVRWNPQGRAGVSAFAPIERDPLSGITNGGSIDGPREADSIDRLREDLFAVGTLGAINYVVRGLRELPGRKSVILFSDGFRLYYRDHPEVNQRVFQAVRRLTDLANRASVVIYTMDARGLQTLGITAADDLGGKTRDQVQQSLQDRRDQFQDTQDGLHYLADETGGFFIRNTNDLNRGIRRVLDDQQGYYLLGYVPEAASFRAARGVTPFHKISVKVKRAGLHVRSRTGFYGFSDNRTPTTERTSAQRVFAALTSPFASGDIHLRLTSIFGQDFKAGAFMRSMLHIDPGELTFTTETDGQHKAVVDIVAFTFGDNGQVVDRESREYTIRMPDEAFKRVIKQGLLYNLNVMIKKPGGYQLRIAVRDAGSDRIGSANQYIEVPDIGKKRLALSGLVVQGSDPAKSGQSNAQSVNAAEGAVDETDSQSGPSLRMLRPGMSLDYGFAIYNATAGAANKPQLEAQVILLRDGKPVYTGPAAGVTLESQTDWRQIIAGGRIQLGPKFAPGDYVLQVIVIDKQASEKSRVATQWIDFQVVN